MYVGAYSLLGRERSFVAPSVLFALLFVLCASEMHGDTGGWRFRVHRVHYVIACISRRFVLLFVLS